MKRIIYTLFIIALICTSCNQKEVVKLNQIQVIGSHNSYKRTIQPEVMKLIAEKDSAFAKTLDYSHVSLTQQLELGLRNVEVDVIYDPEGGRFQQPWANKQLNANQIDPLSYDTLNEMSAPGFKVMHIPDLDFRTWNYTFKSALLELKLWSDLHPDHTPVVITVNAKASNFPAEGLTPLLAFNDTAFNLLDKELFDYLTADKLITPDDVRGDYSTLNDAVLNQGWPKLDRVRGKFLFVLDEGGAKRNTYLKDHESLAGRAMFVKSEPNQPYSSFFIINDPIAYKDSIQVLVKHGYMVRTRADADTKEARNNDYTRFKAAKESGAQVITTDYYLPDEKLGNDYHISFPDSSKERKNPLF